VEEHAPSNVDLSITEFPGLTFRGIQGEGDYGLLRNLIIESQQADGIVATVTLEEIAQAYARSDSFDPARNILIASLASTPGRPPAVIGYGKVTAYSGLNEVRLYHQRIWLLRAYRDPRLWSALLRQNERRSCEIAAGQPVAAQPFFQAWASDREQAWIAILESNGYRAVRRFNNMLHRLTELPDRPLPAGFELRPVTADHLRPIWEAQKEMNAGLFENVAEAWTEAAYPAWQEQAARTCACWQVAWEGDQVAGMVLAHFEAAENEGKAQKRGYTEHIYVRPRWRQRGLASALIARSLQVLKTQGLHEAELGVDAENESAAFRLYQSLGYTTFSVDTWFRKSMPL
jgi:ribosomal protein S18 acetylase RimI-like enzyme